MAKEKKSIEERMKNLDGVLSGIRKEFGKESVMVLGDETPESLVRTSTGSLLLDEAIGGGFPDGRIIEIIGNESSGKCLTKGTYILTKEGYKTIEQIFNENDEETFCVTKTTEKQIELYNENLELENTTHITHNGRRPVRKVKTKTGVEIEGTSNHPLRTISENGIIVWKMIKDITLDDYLIQPRKKQVFGSKELPFNEAYLLGCFIADASFQEKRVSITNDDPDVKSLVEDECSSIFNLPKYKLYENNTKGSMDYHFNSKEFVKKFYEKYKIVQGNAKDKFVPPVIMQGSKETVKAFLQGYFDCESFIDDKSFEVTSASKRLLVEIKLLLSQFGIISSLNQKKVKAYPDNYYGRINVSGYDCVLLINEIGAYSNKIKDRHMINLEYFKEKKNKRRYDGIPNLKYLIKDMLSANLDRVNGEFITSKDNTKDIKTSYDILERITKEFPDHFIIDYFKDLVDKNYYFDKIIAIEDIGEIPTFDFTMEKSHSFIANGVISHNTTMALHAIAECQKIGGVCAFIDAEHALDPEYAEALGVDISSIIISQPDSGEQALDISEALIKSGDISFLVVDSVSALVPQAELDGTMGQSHMGLQARLMSQAMRKITGVVQKSGTTVIFINQYRSKIGFVMGDPRIGSGGSALKYYASIRLEIARIETTKEGGEATANRVRVKVIKNKTYPPYKTIETAIIFGEGIDKMSEIIDMAVKFDIVNKAGSWYSYNDEKIGQGKSKVKNLLEENETLKEEIIVKVKAKIEENKVKVKNKRTPVEEAIEVEDKEEEKENE